MDYSVLDIAKMIDHAILTPAATVAEMEAGIQLAVAYDVASVCILPYFVRRCAEALAGTQVAPSTTVGFPHGAHATAVKEREAARAAADGARELDMVVNVSKTLSGDWDYVRRDIEAVIDVARDAGIKIKVIFENCWLNDRQKIRLCEICGDLRADWIKTSTGFGAGGATLHDLKLMRFHAPDWVQVKAAGGIADLDTVLSFRAVGATRIGTSRTAAILDECRSRIA